MIKLESVVRDARSIELAKIAENFDFITVFYAESNKELWSIAYNFSFFSNIKTIVYPEWDCDFYDNNSPSRHILTARINALYKILQNKNKAVVLTTPKAIVPLTIPVEVLIKSAFSLKTEQSTDIDILSRMLTDLGYIRVDNALSYGDYAIRGDIIDIANIDNEIGHRIDIFGDKIEKIKHFSLASQISTGKIFDFIDILPVDEVIMSSQTLEVFKNKTNDNKNSNYQSIINGVKIMNYVHYLPFFYKKPASFFDFFNTKYQIVNTNQSHATMANIANEIEISYARTLKDVHGKYCYPEPCITFTSHNRL